MRALLCAATLASLLAACGGGGDAADDAAAQQVAQGHAADAAVMPVAATNAIDSATTALEAAVGATPAGGGRAQPLAAALQATGTATCQGGGTVAWSVAGGTAETLANGRLDAGETYTATFDGCVTGDSGHALDGGLVLAVTAVGGAAGSAESDYAATASTLTLTTDLGRYTLDGSVAQRRSRATTPVGGTQVSAMLASNGLTLATTSATGNRQASYTLRSLAWAVVRTYDDAGRLSTRTHQGSGDLAASTPRRPAATLAITTDGLLALGADGLVATGAFTVRTARDTIACTYGSGTALLTLDRGNDGTIDRRWTLPRSAFIDAAG